MDLSALGSMTGYLRDLVVVASIILLSSGLIVTSPRLARVHSEDDLLRQALPVVPTAVEVYYSSSSLRSSRHPRLRRAATR